MHTPRRPRGVAGRAHAPAADLGRSGAPSLRRILVTLDVVAVSLAWVIALLVPGGFRGSFQHHTADFFVEIIAVTGASILVMFSQRLYLARVCGVRAVEIARLFRASALSGVIALIVSSQLQSELSVGRAAFGAVLTFVFLSAAREFYGAWLKRGRTRGRFSRPIVLVGTNDEAFELYRLLRNHPELGFRVVGIAGPREGLLDWDTDTPWLGNLADTPDIVKTAGANGVVLATSALTSEELNQLSRKLLRAEVHVHLSSGLKGIDHRRLRALPLAHEPLFYLERASLSRWQLWTKKTIDVVLATLGLLLALPVLLVTAAAIKLQDGGPVFFRQTRIGRDGRPFTVLKLRTMVPDAEDQIVTVNGINQRHGGPLFKHESDPRRTPIGRFLEATSIDELPQLINVLRGDMSVVGPRPALPDEVAQFDDELLVRQSVAPGITGLWQVEARDNPAFDAYRRLDLFYVENWSISLDLAIMWATIQAIIGRMVLRREQRPLSLTAVSTALDPEATRPS
jgi:exopolysaccharide biosynthesis polyprenyl glycosylphosphotransferase